MIKLINVNKYYQSGNDKVHVIRNLNYEFPDTGLIFILGPSGSGKSTLLNLLGGLDKPDSGEIWIENREISSFNKKEHNYYLNSYLGFVFQEYNILKDLNLKENISLSLEIQGIKTKIAKRKINKIIEEVELTGLEKRKVSQLSGGQKQRLAIARMLLNDKPIIIFDDSLSAVDTETDLMIRKALKENSHATTIIITHRITTARQADKIIVLENGKASKIGTHEELISEDGLYKKLWDIQGDAEKEFFEILNNKGVEV